MLFGKKNGPPTWIVVFLGNPGQRFEGTRHNAGFLTGDVFAGREHIAINRARFQALTAVCEVGGENVLLMKPQTFMNLSGEAVSQAVRFYKIPPERVLVVSDEMALPVGKIRVRTGGSAGGHNGLKNIISHLGTDAFPRIRLGVGAPPHPDYDTKDWVLSAFRGKDAEAVQAAAVRAAEAVESYIVSGPEKTMSRFN